MVVLGSSGTPVWSPQGVLLAVGALLAWTTYWILSKHVRQDVPALDYMTAVTLTAAVVVTPVALLSGQSFEVRWQDWLWLLLFVAGAQGGHSLLAWSHAQVDVSISSLLLLAQPIIAVAGAALLLDERLRALEIVGGVVVIASMAAIVTRAARAGGGAEIGTPEAAPP
jgi:drug/metabolite transporter (DMT)-like permease